MWVINKFLCITLNFKRLQTFSVLLSAALKAETEDQTIPGHLHAESEWISDSLYNVINVDCKNRGPKRDSC